MKQTLIHNIGLMLVDNHHKPYLAGSEMSHDEILHDAWLLIEGGRFKDFGVDSIPSGVRDRIDAKGGAVMPSLPFISRTIHWKAWNLARRLPRFITESVLPSICFLL